MYVTFYLYSFLRSCEALVVGRRFLSGHAIRLRLIYTGTRYTWYAQFVLPCNRVTLHAYQVQYPNCLVIPRLTVYLSPRVLLHIPPPFDAFFILYFFFPKFKVFLEQLEGELESENPWERVVSLVDTQTEIVEDYKDTGRMTSILIQLKNDPLDVSVSATGRITVLGKKQLEIRLKNIRCSAY